MLFISSVREGLSTTKTSSKTKYPANMADFKHGGDSHISCVATGIHLRVCFQILKRFFNFKSPGNWYCKVFQVTYANHSQLIRNVKSHFKEFLLAKMTCVSKLLQAKVWYLLANVQLTTVSVEPWPLEIPVFSVWGWGGVWVFSGFKQLIFSSCTRVIFREVLNITCNINP